MRRTTRLVLHLVYLRRRHWGCIPPLLHLVFVGVREVSGLAIPSRNICPLLFQTSPMAVITRSHLSDRLH